MEVMSPAFLKMILYPAFTSVVKFVSSFSEKVILVPSEMAGGKGAAFVADIKIVMVGGGGEGGFGGGEGCPHIIFRS
jgi:hypothetical protein